MALKENHEFTEDPWIQTVTGRPVEPLRLTPADICIEDIAGSLAKICRFNGHVKDEPYSVAQHSILVAGLVRDAIEGNTWTLTALLHDATEAYIGDWQKPWKYGTKMGILFRHHEDNIARVIRERFGTHSFDHPLIKWADLVLLATERRDVMGPCEREWESIRLTPPLVERIEPWSWRRAESQFLALFEQLIDEDKDEEN